MEGALGLTMIGAGMAEVEMEMALVTDWEVGEDLGLVAATGMVNVVLGWEETVETAMAVAKASAMVVGTARVRGVWVEVEQVVERVGATAAEPCRQRIQHIPRSLCISLSSQLDGPHTSLHTVEVAAMEGWAEGMLALEAILVGA